MGPACPRLGRSPRHAAQALPVLGFQHAPPAESPAASRGLLPPESRRSRPVDGNAAGQRGSEGAGEAHGRRHAEPPRHDRGENGHASGPRADGGPDRRRDGAIAGTVHDIHCGRVQMGTTARHDCEGAPRGR
eukprot:14709062-Alexandrium_andersonii.AAC.1